MINLGVRGVQSGGSKFTICPITGELANRKNSEFFFEETLSRHINLPNYISSLQWRHPVKNIFSVFSRFHGFCVKAFIQFSLSDLDETLDTSSPIRPIALKPLTAPSGDYSWS